jgi:hypothetical protein
MPIIGSRGAAALKNFGFTNKTIATTATYWISLFSNPYTEFVAQKNLYTSDEQQTVLFNNTGTINTAVTMTGGGYTPEAINLTTSYIIGISDNEEIITMNKTTLARIGRQAYSNFINFSNGDAFSDTQAYVIGRVTSTSSGVLKYNPSNLPTGLTAIEITSGLYLPSDVACTASNVYVVGTNNSVDRDIVLAKYNSTLSTLSWAINITKSGTSLGNSRIAIDNNENIYILYYTENTIFNIHKINSSGSVLYSKTITVPSIYTGSLGNLYDLIVNRSSSVDNYIYVSYSTDDGIGNVIKLNRSDLSLDSACTFSSSAGAFFLSQGSNETNYQIIELGLCFYNNPDPVAYLGSLRIPSVFSQIYGSFTDQYGTTTTTIASSSPTIATYSPTVSSVTLTFSSLSVSASGSVIGTLATTKTVSSFYVLQP